MGSDIDGTTSDDGFGKSVAINDDGTVVAIGTDSNDDNSTNGKALVYHYHNNTYKKVIHLRVIHMIDLVVVSILMAKVILL